MSRSRRRVSGSELDQLRRSGRLDSDASKVALCQVYELTDGRVLLVYGNDSIAFVDASYRELARSLAENEHTSGQIVDEFEGLFPSHKTFVDCVDAMIADLPSLLQLSTSRIDFSDDELAAIDRKLRKLSRTQFKAPKLYAAVVAYVGEFVRRRVDGKWEMTQTGSLPPVPKIVDSAGAVRYPTRLSKLFLDSGHVPSIKSFIARTLGRH
jgi:hypothetical protein